MSTPPIRRNKHLAPLSHDHHDGLLFCWKIRQGLKHHTDPERILGYVRYFWQEHLRPHFGEEEQYLFILPGKTGDERAPGDERSAGDERTPGHERVSRDERIPGDERATGDERAEADEKTERAIGEHRRIAALIEGLLNGAGGQTEQQLALLADTVDQHIRYEERDLFPYLEQRLSEAQLEDIGRHLSTAPHACDSWPDECWRAPNRSHSSE